MDMRQILLNYHNQNLLANQLSAQYGQSFLLDAINMIRQNLPQMQMNNTTVNTMSNNFPNNIPSSMQSTRNFSNGNQFLGLKREIENSHIPPEYFQSGNQTHPLNFQTNSNDDARGDFSSMISNRPVFTANLINNNNSTQIFLPSPGDGGSRNCNKNYNNDKLTNNKNIVNTSNIEGVLLKQSQSDSNNRKETQEQAMISTSEAASNTPVDKTSKNKPIKQNTNCPHPDARHYAKNMCNNCYHSRGRKKLSWKCPHKSKSHYALGICQNCYQANYNKARKIPETEEN